MAADSVLLHFSFNQGKRKGWRDKNLFIYTILGQYLAQLPVERATLILRDFLCALLDQYKRLDNETTIWNIVQMAPLDISTYVFKMLAEEQRKLFLSVRGISDMSAGEAVLAFLNGMRQQCRRGIKCLVTSEPLASIKSALVPIPYIDGQEESRGKAKVSLRIFLIRSFRFVSLETNSGFLECSASLRFKDMRYERITPEYEGAFQWLWKHPEYLIWCRSASSKMLYIQGKPGSGKSTLTKYFSRRLRDQEPAASSATVGKFFYSHRDGDSQKSHYNMLRLVLGDIIEQDSAFFYQSCQAAYRKQVRKGTSIEWDYETLKTLLKSLVSVRRKRPVYLILDAVDESNESDRRDILDLLRALCSTRSKCVIKIFVASRPLGSLEVMNGQDLNRICLQDQTQSDITHFVRKSLEGLHFELALHTVTEYIVENADGVFLWVKLAINELVRWIGEGLSEAEISTHIQRLPTELESFYELMLSRMQENEQDLPIQRRLLHLVLFCQRPLEVDELLQALAFQRNNGTGFAPLTEIQRHTPSERRIISAGGNFIEIKDYRGMNNGSMVAKITA